MALNIYQKIIVNAFEEQNWNYTSENVSQEKSVFFIDFTSDTYGTTKCRVIIFESGICDIEAVLPIICRPEQYEDLCYYLAKHNYSQRYSTLRLNVDSGEIENSYSFLFNQSTTSEQFLKYFSITQDIDNSVIDDLCSICKKEDTILGNQSENGKHKIRL